MARLLPAQVFVLTSAVAGVASVGHSGDHGLHGVRLTVRASVASLKTEPDFRLAPPPHRWLTAGDVPAASMHRDELAPLLLTALTPADAGAECVVPLLHIDLVHDGSAQVPAN
jgi:hypothetical protein